MALLISPNYGIVVCGLMGFDKAVDETNRIKSTHGPNRDGSNDPGGLVAQSSR